MLETLIQLHQCSAVILADSHNPTILHPAFLSSQGIVPSEWQTKDQETVCTLPFSRVSYTSGVAIVAEPTKLQVTDTEIQAGPHESAAPTVAANYVGVLPHVNYTAVGINFDAFCEVADATAAIVGRFIKEGPWLADPLLPTAGGVRLRYPFGEGRVSVSIDRADRRDDEGGSREGILLKINYHFDIAAAIAEESTEKVQAMLLRHGEFCDHYANLSSTLLAQEAE